MHTGLFRGAAAMMGLGVITGLWDGVVKGNEPYRRPPEAIARLVEAPTTPGVSMSPLRTHMLLIERASMPPVADLAAPMLRLAGDRIDPSTNGPHGPRLWTGMSLRTLTDTQPRKLDLPADADLSMPAWSPDGRLFAFTNTTSTGIELWVGDAESAGVRRLTGPVLNAAYAAPMRWMPDSARILVLTVDPQRGADPVRPAAPNGPVTQESVGKTAQVRTFQDLLQDAHDEALFDHYMTSVPAYVDVKTGAMSPIAGPALYGMMSPSPDGRFLLVSRTVRPYSYIVPAGLFPEMVEVWDAVTGKPVREIAGVPLREEIPIQGVQTGPRSFSWRDLPGPGAPGPAGGTLVWLEALDGGDPKTKAPHRDRIMLLDAPFDGESREAMRLEHRFRSLSWIDQPGFAMVSEFDRDRRWARMWLANIDSEQDVSHRVMWDMSVNDRYNAKGSPLTRPLPSGRSVVRVNKGSILLAGQGATPEGDRPFLDRMSLSDFTAMRLWRNEGESLESVVDILDDEGTRLITRRETPTEPPNFFVRNLAGGTIEPITTFPDPQPDLRGVKKQLVKYTRADGVELSATVYTPPGYDPARDGPLPLFVWAYPLEFNDAGTAGQVSGSPRTFTRLGGASHLFLVMAGYAVMHDATMPIVGDPETMNDTFVEQIASSAKAAIDRAVAMGIATPDRVAVGGHSYGAFMTANLLAHTDLFRAGIARSGAYNRTLTPFGFQGERRTFWEAPDAYARLSPFNAANKINEPILLIHGMLDANPGTFPMQSERLFSAIKGHGGTVRLVELPYEDHGYAGRESVLHTLAEMVDWLDRHVKNTKPSDAGKQGG